MNNFTKYLSNYYNILHKKQKAKYLLSKQIKVSFNKSDSTDELWILHDKTLIKNKISNTKIKQSLLDLKFELANRIFNNCCFCERRCGVNRYIKAGNCKVKQSVVSSEFLHMDEENILVPSHTIFFSGCTFHCVFCQNWDISQEVNGLFISPGIISETIHKRKNQGSRNVNWVGGDPTPNLFFILKVLEECNDNIAQIWNSNMYCSNETMRLLDGIIDIYLTDFKYGNNTCAKKLSKVDNYLEITKRNHKLAYDNSELIIRHLVMPNHIECCSKPILKWVSKNIPNSIVNIMAQYKPEYKACDYEDINRRVYLEELLAVKEYAEKIGIKQI